ncbi:DUF4327 family protein [Gloeothece verrucosa]|uniref:DUF4327 domain-containing protein n=1 Tax=Gloeothece verrucosa (strain PCC 7822) TaxID=497965 RepID=E0U8Y8_GLOV7|nr:DUF4327 family protein [Gloeothece verrucosa]ADN16127.1 conserved hypothetical protein [Gloeothece verrucosa PCC 7822]
MVRTASISVQYTIDLIQEDARNLVKQGRLDRQQPIYTLCQYIPPREWSWVENELERHGYLLRDHLIDLLGSETWDED